MGGMMTAGAYTLFAGQITAALTAQAQTAIEDLDGMLAATFVARFVWGSGGTTVSASVETSLDGGTIWYQIASFEFTTADSTQYATLSGLTEGVSEGLLGPMMRAVITSTGTYGGGTLLDLRMVAR